MRFYPRGMCTHSYVLRSNRNQTFVVTRMVHGPLPTCSTTASLPSALSGRAYRPVYGAAVRIAIFPGRIFSWTRDPAAGLMCIQSRSHGDASRLASGIFGGRDWNAGCGNDRQDAPRAFFSGQIDQADLSRPARVARGRAEGRPVERDRVLIGAVSPAASRIGPRREQLDARLDKNDRKSARERLTLIRLFEELRGLDTRGAMQRSSAPQSRGDRNVRARQRRRSYCCPLRRAKPTSSTGATRSSSRTA